jgi:hypothetical protein
MQHVQYSWFLSVLYLPNLFTATANVGESELVSFDSPTSAVAVNRFDKYQMLHVQF